MVSEKYKKKKITLLILAKENNSLAAHFFILVELPRQSQKMRSIDFARVFYATAPQTQDQMKSRLWTKMQNKKLNNTA